MPEARVTIASQVGLHARPAALFVQAAANHQGSVRVGRPGQSLIDGKSMLAVLGLGAEQGEELLIRTEGEGGASALEALAALVSQPDHADEATPQG